MKWDKYTIETTTEAEELVGVLLSETGIDGIEIENNVPLTEEETAGMFIDFPPELPPDDGTSRISFYLEHGKDHSRKLREIRAGLERLRDVVSVGTGIITSSETEDLDWLNNWKEFFHSFCIDDLLIKPTWEEIKKEDADKLLIEIDPGVSFGTGKHETTQLCIRQLRKYLKPGDKVLDVGCGSGILSIAALKLGAAAVVGTDIDEVCIQSTMENMRVNHLEESEGSFYAGNLIDDAALREQVGTNCFDLVVANILADVIIPMAEIIPDRLKENGIFITSGIIDFKEQETAQAIREAGFEILETNHQGEWVNITAKKQAK
ncbi:MAG: 50S ribosomal protein L11 methyltransferase [Lachnospiraceae bacterium]|nr:50S ribosomal protein L11 methyltransferase [Lachnospiraceae bacterium]